MRVGLLIGTYNNSYTLGVIKYISNELKGKNSALVILDGLSLSGNTLSDYSCNTICRLITKERLDALILLSSTLVTHVCKETIEELSRRMPIPTVSLGIALEGIPSIVVDNSSGFEQIVSHLIAHGYKKFAHISGPLRNPEALLRRDAFMKIIFQNGLELPKNHLLEGTFGYSSGYNVTRRLVEAIKAEEIDAIVCANDHMAYGAVKCLYENNILVPEDVAITGFDDYSMSVYFNPPITTVSQRLEEMCGKAVSLIFKMRHQKKSPEVFTFAPELVVRNSCGCTQSTLNSRTLIEVPITGSFRIIGRLQFMDNDKLNTFLCEALYENGLDNCYIVRYTEPVAIDDLSALKQGLKCKLFFGYSNGKRIYHGNLFDIASLLPDPLLEAIESPYFIKTLFFGKMQFGYIVVSANENSAYLIDDLGPEISLYFENYYLAQERQAAQKKLSDTLESLVLTNRKLNELTVKENLDKMNNLRLLAANMLQHRKSGNGDYYLILVEIDNFIEVNNQFGFDEGEAMINTVSQMLASSIREDDFLSHQSCERYVILVKNIQGGAIEAIERRFKEKKRIFNEAHTKPYPILFTWGYAAATVNSNFDAIYQEAEMNLMKSKDSKRSDAAG